MATLKAQILSDLRTVIAEDTLADLTNQRGAGSSEDTNVTDKAASFAANLIQGMLGSDVDGTDVEAVMHGVDLVVQILSQRFTLDDVANGTPKRATTMQALRDLQRRRRITNTSPTLYAPDYETADRIFDVTEYEDEI